MNEGIKEKLKTKIAISQIKNEEVNAIMNKKGKFTFKNIEIAACVLVSLTGVTFASSKVIEKVWKKPEKVQIASNNIEDMIKITEESKKENITEERAKEIAVQKLDQLGLNSEIIGTNHYKEIDSDKIIFRFDTKDNYEISIDGKTGNFSTILNNNKNVEDTNKYITKEQAIEVANKYYKLLGYKER